MWLIINDIIVFDVNDYYIVCEVLHTCSFIPHYHAYEVTRTDIIDYVFVKQAQLADHNVLGLYMEMFVILKYYITTHNVLKTNYHMLIIIDSLKCIM